MVTKSHCLNRNVKLTCDYYLRFQKLKA